LNWSTALRFGAFSERSIAPHLRGLGRELVPVCVCALCLLRPVGVSANTPSDSGDWEEAQAVESWPPDATRFLDRGMLGRNYYIPFFYTGRCYKELQDCFRALRFFGLAKCRAEVTKTPDSGSLESEMGWCKTKTRSTKRPDRHKEYQEGRIAYNSGNWEEAALRMWEALQVWDESYPPIQTRTYGRYPEPYIPRFYLARSLLELKCYSEALSQFDKTVVGHVSEGAVKEGALKKEKEELSEWRTEAKKRIDGGEENEICARWACWLGGDGTK
jgi:hypothetical protein